MATEQVDIPPDVQILYDCYAPDDGRISITGIWGRESLPSGEVSYQGRVRAYIYQDELDEMIAATMRERLCTKYMAERQALDFLLRRDGVISVLPAPVSRRKLRDRYWGLRFRLALIILRLAELIAGEGLRDYAD